MKELMGCGVSRSLGAILDNWQRWEMMELEARFTADSLLSLSICLYAQCLPESRKVIYDQILFSGLRRNNLFHTISPEVVLPGRVGSGKVKHQCSDLTVACMLH